MNSSGDNPHGDESSAPTDRSPERLTQSVRAGIAAYFGARGDRDGAPPERPADYGRLIADLERRILDSLQAADEPPPLLGPFQLEERIGRGGFAVVYRATHVRTGARAAVKVVPAADAASRRRVASEVECLARLQHPNVVRIIDTGEESGFAWIATEYIEGATLQDEIRAMNPAPDSFQFEDGKGEQAIAQPRGAAAATPRSRDAIRRAIIWFRDLALALDALHQTGVVHRDVKPANILIDRAGRPCLIDFGLSSSAETTVDGILAGTVPYMSPEQTLGGYLALTPRSDLYSLAVTFHEVLTGERVTRGVRRDAILHQIAFVAVAPPSTIEKAVPASLDPIFARALAKDSDARYGSGRELADDLDRWLADRPLAHAVEPPRARAARFVRKHPVTSALLAAAVVAGVAWSTFTIAQRERMLSNVVASIRADLDAGAPAAALDTIARWAPSFLGRDAFQQVHREAVRAGAPALVHDLLATQAFAASGFPNEPHHVALARKAKFHLEASGAQDPNLVLVAALSEHLLGRPAGAAAILDEAAPLVAGFRPLLELSAIVAIGTNDTARFGAALSRLKAEAPQEISTAEICLRAWRTIYGRRNPPLSAAATSAADIDQVEADVARVLRNRADHGLARALLGVLKMERKDFRGARAEFDHLVKAHGGSGERTGNLLMYAIASMLVAGDSSGRDDADAIDGAVRYAKDALAAEPSMHVRFLREITPASFRARVAWIIAALGGDWTRRPGFGPEFLTFAAATLTRPPEAREPGVIGRAARLLDAEYGARLDGAMTRDYVAIRATELWEHRDLAGIALRADRPAEAAAHFAAARRCVEETRSRTSALPYVMVAGEALVAAEQARLEPDLAKRSGLAAAATLLLRNATAPGLLDAALKEAPNRESAEQLRGLAHHCATALELIESAEDGN